jgi:hypothetical protein
MLFDEQLRDAVARDRCRQLAERLRHREFDLPRGGLLTRWRARRAARRAAAATAPAAPAHPASAPQRSGSPLIGMRRTMPDMYR